MVRVVTHPDTYACEKCGHEHKYRVTAEACEASFLGEPTHKVGDRIRVYHYGADKHYAEDTVVEVRLLHAGPAWVIEAHRTEEQVREFLATRASDRQMHCWGLRVAEQHFQFDDPSWYTAWFEDTVDLYTEDQIHGSVDHPPSHTSGMSYYGDEECHTS